MWLIKPMHETLRRPGMAEPEDRIQLVVVRIGEGAEFALSVDRVQEVVPYARPMAIASRTPWMSGLMSLRGTVMPVCELALRLGVETDRDPRRLLVTTPGSSGQVAFAVDDVTSIEHVPDSALERVRASGDHDPAVDAVAHIDDRLLIILDPDRLLASTDTVETAPPQEDA